MLETVARKFTKLVAYIKIKHLQCRNNRTLSKQLVKKYTLRAQNRIIVKSTKSTQHSLDRTKAESQ